jgi:hypothetical protein
LTQHKDNYQNVNMVPKDRVLSKVGKLRHVFATLVLGSFNMLPSSNPGFGRTTYSPTSYASPFITEGTFYEQKRSVSGTYYVIRLRTDDSNTPFETITTHHSLNYPHAHIFRHRNSYIVNTSCKVTSLRNRQDAAGFGES